MSNLPSDLVLKNARVPASLIADQEKFGGRRSGDCLSGDVIVKSGCIAGMTDISVSADLPVIDLQEKLVFLKLTEAHCHLDKCHTIERMPDAGGDLMAAGSAQKVDKENWTAEDIRERAERGLTELYEAGCGYVRTHIDWQMGAKNPPLAWHVINELAHDWRDKLQLHTAALIDLDHFEDHDLGALTAGQVASNTGVLGAFILGHENTAPKLDRIFALANEHGLHLDFHVDESLEGHGDGVEAIADASLRNAPHGAVLCGHACSLINRQGDHLQQVIEKLARAEIGIAALPSTNLYLQSRNQGTPTHRGLTCVHELVQGGVNVVFGSDNVRDAFCPIGFHDPMSALSLGALSAHLDPPYDRWLTTVTTNAAKVIGNLRLSVDQAALDDLVFSEAKYTSELVAGLKGKPRRLENLT
ncbi:MAG: amidohydrolase family protein [Hyphomicrobiales bacterium]